MPEQSMQYGSTTDTDALTITLDGLASDATLLAGRQCTPVVNTSTNFLDVLVSGQFVVGASPTDDKRIEIWAFAAVSLASSVPTYPAGFAGADADISVASEEVKRALFLIDSLATNNTASQTYSFGPISLGAAFGAIPTHWGLFVVHDTGVALGVGCSLHMQGLKVQSA